MKRIFWMSGLMLTGALQAGVFLTDNVNQAVPDGDAGGLLRSATVAGAAGTIQSLRVSLQLDGAGVDGGSNGDLYAFLRHGDGFAVLLNRPGRRSDSGAGYGDNGLSVVFDESAAADIHDYRVTLSGSPTTVLTGPLTGTWKPDGRNVDPEATISYDSVPRTATLASFNGMDPNGVWDLHVFDLASGGEVTLASWALEFTAVPEPAFATGGVALGLLALAAWRRCKPSSGVEGSLKG